MATEPRGPSLPGRDRQDGGHGQKGRRGLDGWRGRGRLGRRGWPGHRFRDDQSGWRGRRHRDDQDTWPGPRLGEDAPAGTWCPLPGPAGYQDAEPGGSRPGGPGGGRPSWFSGFRLAAVVAVIAAGTTFAWHAHTAGTGERQLNPAGWALLVLVSLALTLRLRYPPATLAIVGAGASAYFALGNPAGIVFLPLTIALGAAILSGYRLLAWLSCPVIYAFVVFGPYYLARAGPAPGLSEAVSDAAWPLLILIGAEMLRAGRERAATAARGRAEHARRQAEQARRRASEERVRIAQELHDVVAHNISLINVQAGVALHLMDSEDDRSPEQTRAALAAIKHASKETLGELRSVLGILRAEPGTHAPLTPTAGLDQLDGLISGAVSAGLSVHTETAGDRVPLPPSTDLAAYRIVQEALTNVIKHVGPAAVSVAIRYGETRLAIEVTDDGGASADGTGADGTGAGRTSSSGTGGTRTDGSGATGSSPGTAASGGARRSVAAGTGGGEAGDDSENGGGSGIPGMRERVRMLGGEFSAGPQPGGGFRVSAALPLRMPAEAGDAVGDLRRLEDPGETLPPGPSATNGTPRGSAGGSGAEPERAQAAGDQSGPRPNPGAAS